MKSEKLKDDFIQLVREHERIIYKICFLYAGNETGRHDLYQEIVFQLWKGFPRFRGDAKFSTWLYQVAINTAIAEIRHEKKSVSASTHDGTLPEIADNNPDQQQSEQYEILYAAINQLNDIEKAITMLYLENKGYDEMEIIIGISSGALRVKMSRIKEKLRNITKNTFYGT